MKKYIFLDFDGVLRPFGYTEVCEKLYATNSFCKTRDVYGYYFAPYALDALKFIVASTGAQIVISSDWRKNGFKEIKEMWLQRGYPFPDRIIGITPFLESAIRGREISQWINQHEKKIYSYVILDDHDDMGTEHKDRLVQTNKSHGLTLNEANKAIDILNQKYIPLPKPKDDD